MHDWPKDRLNKFTLENCFFRATNIVKNSDKSKYVYGRYGIAFDGLGSWSLGFFGVDNESSSSHTDNRKNNFLILGEAHTDDINDSIGAAEKNFSINFSKPKTKCCLSLHYNHDNSYLFVKGK